MHFIGVFFYTKNITGWLSVKSAGPSIAAQNFVRASVRLFR
jgi:hypothetical protein